MKKDEYCPHCLPTKKKRHTSYHLEYYIDRCAAPFLKLTHILRHPFILRVADLVFDALFDLFRFFRILSCSKNPKPEMLYNRSLLFFDEAKKRGIDICNLHFFGANTNEFFFRHNGKRYYYEGIPLKNHDHPIIDIDNKFDVKHLLQKNDIPVPRGRVFTSKKNALRYGAELHFPLVVKPNGGSLSFHTTVDIRTYEELEQAFDIGKIFRPDVIVEEFITGDLYRATVIGQKQVFVCKKDKANVVGDGASTIAQLIEEKNADPNRGGTDQKNTTLHVIEIDEQVQHHLFEQQLTLDSVLPTGKKVYLHDKYILSQGCDIIGCTEKTHQKNKDLFIRVARLLRTNLVGIDIIMQDPAIPYTEQKFGIIETNSLPYIDMHQIVSDGEPDNVAEAVWDTMLEQLK